MSYSVTKYPQSNYGDAVPPAWTNPANCYADDGSYASATPAVSNSVRSYFYNFDFQLPSNAVISSIVIEAQFYCSTNASTFSFYFGGTKNKVNISYGTDATEPTSPKTVTHTLSSIPFTTDELNENGIDMFSVFVQVTRTTDPDAVVVYCDYVKVTVNYDLLFTPSNDDSISFSEGLSYLFTHGRSYNDSVSFSELLVYELLKSISESVSFSESTSVDGQPTAFADNLYLAEVISKTLYTYRLEYTPFVDSIWKRMLKYPNEVISFAESLLQNWVYSKELSDYINFTESVPKSFTKSIQDNLVSLNETVDRLLRAGAQILFWKEDELFSFAEYHVKEVDRYQTEQVNFWDVWFMVLRDEVNNIWKVQMNDWLRNLTESVVKTIKVYKSDDVSFLMTLSNNSAILIQDTVTFIDDVIKSLHKYPVDTINFVDVATTLLTVPLYFDHGRIEPRYVITDLRIYGGAEMQFYAGQTADVRWKHRRFDTDLLDDPDSHTVEIYDSRNVLRVAYEATKLLKESTGVYKYYFTLPSDVIVGDWYAKVTATKGTATTVLTIHFDVKER